MVEAAQAWARGQVVQTAPASLRVLSLSRFMKGPVVSILDEPYELLRELECYAAAEAAEERAKRASEARVANGGRGRRRR